MTGTDKKTVLRLLADVGDACGAFLDESMRDLKCKRIQADEIWSFCSAKQRNVPADRKGDPTTAHVDVGRDGPDSKLVVSYMLGKRDPFCAKVFIRDLSDGLRSDPAYDGRARHVRRRGTGCVRDQVDYAMLIKVYGREGEDGNPETRYSPAEVTSTRKVIVMGDPDGRTFRPRY